MPQPKLTFILDEPMAELSNLVRRVVQSRGVGVFVRGESVKVIDSSAYLHDEAALLDAEELTDAREALIEDRIFTRAEAMNDEVQLRAAVK